MNYKRHITYILIILALSLPLAYNFTIEPARLKSAEKAFEVVETTPVMEGQLAVLAFDFSPSTKAENEAQANALVEHLFRRRIPVIVFSFTVLAEGFLKSVPQEVAAMLMKEQPNQKWEYGKDWINIGYKPGAGLFLQGLGQTDNLSEFFGKDILGVSVNSYPRFSKAKTLKDILFISEMSGSLAIDSFIQFLRRDGYAPKIIYGPTSILIPQSYIYLDSGQISGLLEGISGAAWYAKLIQEKYQSHSESKVLVLNSSLGIAQLVILTLILVGNIIEWSRRKV